MAHKEQNTPYVPLGLKELQKAIKRIHKKRIKNWRSRQEKHRN